MKKSKLLNTCNFLFSEGWCFLVPYLLVFLAAKPLGLSVNTTKLGFLGLHFLTGLALLWFVCNNFRRWRRVSVVFWSLLFLAFLLPGAYLEYPSDPWLHYSKIFEWEISPYGRLSTVENRFAYFWNWTTLFWIPPEHRRAGLDWTSALWQWLVCFQVWALARELGLKRNWALIQTVAFVALFGTSLFGIRYYALAATPIAMVAYYRALTTIVRMLNRKTPLAKSWTLLPLSLLILVNHMQEAIFLGISIVALVIAKAWDFIPTKFPRSRIPILIAGASIYLGSLLVGLFVFYKRPELYKTLGFNQICRVGVFRIWDPTLQFFQTLGIPGFTAYFLAIILFKKHRQVALLTLLPLAVLLFPPTALLYSMALATYAPTYRILYTFPLSIILIQGIVHVWRWGTNPDGLFASTWFKQTGLIALGALIFGLMFYPHFPIYSRLPFAFLQPAPQKALVPLDATVAWFQHNRPRLDPNCWIISDDATDFALNAPLGRKIRGDRLNPYIGRFGLGVGERGVQRFLSYRDIVTVLDKPENQPVCGFLVADRQLISPEPESFVAQHARHWPMGRGLRWYSDVTWTSPVTEILEANQWKKTPVPPFYSFLEPPPKSERCKTMNWTLIRSKNLEAKSTGSTHLLEMPCSGTFVLINPRRDSAQLMLELKQRGIKAIDALIITQINAEISKGVSDLLSSEIIVKSIYYNSMDDGQCPKIKNDLACRLDGLSSHFARARNNGTAVVSIDFSNAFGGFTDGTLRTLGNSITPDEHYYRGKRADKLRTKLAIAEAYRLERLKMDPDLWVSNFRRMSPIEFLTTNAAIYYLESWITVQFRSRRFLLADTVDYRLPEWTVKGLGDLWSKMDGVILSGETPIRFETSLRFLNQSKAKGAIFIGNPQLPRGLKNTASILVTGDQEVTHIRFEGDSYEIIRKP